MTSEWKLGWETYLSSSKDFIFAHINTQGTTYQQSSHGENEVEIVNQALRYESS